MEDTITKYKDPVSIAFELDGSIQRLSETSSPFKKLTIQAKDSNNDTVLYGGEDPVMQLLPGASEVFYNSDLQRIRVQGTNGEFVNILVEN